MKKQKPSTLFVPANQWALVVQVWNSVQTDKCGPYVLVVTGTKLRPKKEK